MEQVDPASLADLPTRIQYLRKFIDFTKDDAAMLHAAAPVVAPLVPVIVDAVYVKLSSFDITWKSFLPRNTGYEGEAPASLTDLTVDHAQIKFRKDFLKNYLVKLVTMDYEQNSSWEYLNKVGIMHTGEAGFAHRYECSALLHSSSAKEGEPPRAKKPGLRVEYMHCAILLGHVQDIILNAVLTHPDLDLGTKTAVLRAVNKVLGDCSPQFKPRI